MAGEAVVESAIVSARDPASRGVGAPLPPAGEVGAQRRV